MKQVYLDNNATTRLDPMVLEAMMPFLTDFYGNPSSIHDFGIPAQAALERAHQQAAALLGAEYPSEIIFTSCATEATATAIASASPCCRSGAKLSPARSNIRRRWRPASTWSARAT
jgi:cysteine desulfurase